MAISFPGVAAAAGSVGQMLMQKALQDREREERESARQEAMVPRMLQVMAGRDERIAPLEAGAPLPERGREITVGDQRFAAIAPPPEPVEPTKPPPLVETTSGIFTRGASGLEPVIDPVTKAPAMPYQAPSRPTQGERLPFGVTADGITTRVGTPAEAVRLRGQLARPEPAGLPDLTEAEMRVVAQVPDVARGVRVINQVVGEHGIPSLAEHGMARLPFVGQYFTPEEWQRFENAARLAGTAIVRWESGAAIRPEEVEETANKKYVPQPGDKPPLVEQKLAALQDKFRTMTLMTPPEYLQRLGIDPNQIGGAAGAAGTPSAPAPLSWQDRARELKAQGMAPDAVIATLRAEGLMQ